MNGIFPMGDFIAVIICFFSHKVMVIIDELCFKRSHHTKMTQLNDHTDKNCVIGDCSSSPTNAGITTTIIFM